MKIRSGFVSNSSSSSFMIYRENLTWEQDALIHTVCFWSVNNSSSTGWRIHSTYGSIVCYTQMDNFDMEEYLEKIGVDKNVVIWSKDELVIQKGQFDFDNSLVDFNKYIDKKARRILKKMDYNDFSKTKNN